MSDSLDIQAIRHLLPHRYPFLLIDRVTAYEPGQRAEAIKNVTINEPFFQGHFPTQPIMPGVLIVEAMAQLGGVLLMQRTPLGDKLALLTGIDRVRFRRQVVPGDQLILEARYLSDKRSIWKFECKASVAGKEVCSAEIICAERKL